MTPEAAKAYVRRWIETGRLLEDIRWRELRHLDEASALHASEHLLAAASLVPVPRQRREWSGLVDFQDILHRRRPS